MPEEVAYLQMTIAGQNFVFAPFAKTAVNAINGFLAMFNRERARHEGKFPLVALDVRDFTNDAGGKTYVPVFRVVGWSYLDGVPAPELPMVEVKPVAKPVAKPALPKPKINDMDDDIPF